MTRWQILQTVSLYLFILCPLSYANEYFVYMPNVIISQSALNIPTYISHPPGILNLRALINGTRETQSFLLTKSFTEIPFQLFHVERSATQIEIEATLSLCSDIESCYMNRTTSLLVQKSYQIPISPKTHLIVLFTSKNCYLPGEKLQIFVFINRVDELLNTRLSSYPSIHWVNGRFQDKPMIVNKRTQNSQTLMIDLYNGNNQKVAKWEFDPIHKSLTIDFDLLDNVPKGLWKIHYYFPDKSEAGYQEFKVISAEKQLLPRNAKMNISVKYDDDLTINTKNIRFSVCAEYSTIRTVKGKISGNICLKGLEEKLVNERPCLDFNGSFNGSSKCVVFDCKTDKLDLRNVTYDHQSSRLIITVQVVDNFSKTFRSFRFVGPVLENSKYKIIFLSQPYFISMLPYYGKLRTVMHNGKPFQNASVTIQCNTVNFPFHWGHMSKHTSDKDGMISFILSSPPTELNVITCDIEDLSSIEQTYGTLKYYRPSITQTLEKWKSMSTKNIQLKLLERSISNGEKENLVVEIQSNGKTSDHLVMLLISHGQIIKSRYIENRELPKDICQDRDDELGHYTCDRKTGKVTCRKDWEGSNCLSPSCQGNCHYGICVRVNQCFCKYGWTGQFCDKCLPSKSCVNGFCIEGNDCVCRPGWMGYNCDIEGSETQSNKLRNVVKKSILFSNMTDVDIDPIFTTNISWSIPLTTIPLAILVHSVSKNPSSSKLILDPPHLVLNSIVTSDINEASFSTDDSVKCLHIHPRNAMDSLIDSLITINPRYAYLHAHMYNRIISDQCRMPFQKIDKIPPEQITLNLISESTQIDHYDFSNMFKSLKLFPITSMKLVSRTCPIWKILSEYKQFQNLSTGLPKISTSKPILPTRLKENFQFCGCDGECGRHVFNDLKQIPPSHEPYLFSSICTNRSTTRTQSILIQNENVQIDPTFFATIAMINNLKIHEIHHQEIEIFNLIKFDLEMEITTKSESGCLTDEIPERTYVLIKARKSVKIVQNVQFNCSGIFQLFITFKANQVSKSYPNFKGNPKHRIVKTESVVYQVVDGVFQVKTFDFQFCRNDLANSTVNLDFKEDFQPNDFMDFRINILNSLKTMMTYLKYIYRNQKVEHIIDLTMKIYEMNLNKLMKIKRYLNQSQINIKRMIKAELKIIRNHTKLLPLDYEVSLINLCSEIPNTLFSVKRQFCKFIMKKLTKSRYNSLTCSTFDGKFDELILLVSISSDEIPFLQKVNKDKLSFLTSCYSKSNLIVKESLFREVIKDVKNNFSSLEIYIDNEKESMTINQLALVYFLLKPNPNTQMILIKISKIILQKISNTPSPVSKISAVLLLKLFNDLEESLQVNNVADKTLTPTKFLKTFLTWSKDQKLSLHLPKHYVCSNINVQVSYYTSMPWIENNDYRILVNQDRTNCSKVTLSLIFKNGLFTYKSLNVLLPSGWVLDAQSIKSLSGSLCNAVITIENESLKVTFDLYQISSHCSVKTITLDFIRNQKVSNVQTNFVILVDRNGHIFHTPYRIGKCAYNSDNKSPNNKVTTTSEESGFLWNDLCGNHQLIDVLINRKRFSIGKDSKIIVSRKNAETSNRIVLINSPNRIIEANETVLWFLRNYRKSFCNRGRIVAEILSLYSNHNSDYYCLSSQSTSILDGVFHQSLCSNKVFLYFIKQFLVAEKKLTLQPLSNNCNLNSELGNEFNKDLVSGESLSTGCRMLKKITNGSKSRFVLLSSRNLMAESQLTKLKLNENYLVVEFVDF